MSADFLRRYTDLPALLCMLSERKITLLDPKSWDDTNDSYYLAQYRDKQNRKSVLALCFSQVPETYHHWRVFSQGSSGVCIYFRRDTLLAALRKQDGVTARVVEYLPILEARKRTLQTKELPFIKREAFRPEAEFRVVFESDESLPSIKIPIDLSCIDRILLSPWLHKSLTQATKEAIRSVNGCKKLKVSRSNLLSNEEWKTIGGKAT